MARPKSRKKTTVRKRERGTGLKKEKKGEPIRCEEGTAKTERNILRKENLRREFNLSPAVKHLRTRF